MWQVLPGQSLNHRSWDQEAVLYNDLTGDTHLLGADAMAVLLAVRDGARDLGSLCAALGAALGAAGAGADRTDGSGVLHDSGALAQLAEELLGQLAAISLIDACPC